MDWWTWLLNRPHWLRLHHDFFESVGGLATVLGVVAAFVAVYRP